MKKLISGVELLNAPPEYNSGIYPPCIDIGGLTLGDEVWREPTLVQGAMGTGKSTLIERIINGVTEQVPRAGDNIVEFCAKPVLKKTSGSAVIHAGYEATAFWNIFAELVNAADDEQTLREICAGLFRQQMEKTSQIFFPLAAKAMTESSIKGLYTFSQERKVLPSNKDLVRFLMTTPVWGTAGGTPGWLDLAETRPGIFGCVRDYLGTGKGDQAAGVLAELRNMVNETFIGSFAQKGDFCTECLKNGGQHIYIRYDPQYGESSMQVLGVIIDLLMKAAIASEKRTWFFLDEGYLLPHSTMLSDCLSLGRDPRNNHRGGVRIIISMQSARLMTRHYSQEEALALLSLMPNIISFRVNDSLSRQIVQERYGEAHYFERFDTGTKVTVMDYSEPVIHDAIFARLKKGQSICSIPAVSKSPFFLDNYRKELDNEIS